MWLLALAAIGFWLAWSRGLAAMTLTRTFDTIDDVMNETTGTHPLIADLASAIASAEGFGVPGAVPTRAHNPGDLSLGDLGYGVTGDEGITVFANDADGWDRLHRQLQLIVDGRSHVYGADWSIQRIAGKWTDTASDAWTANVVRYLQTHGYPSVTADTTLAELL